MPIGRCAARVLVVGLFLSPLLLSPPLAAQVTVLAPGGISVDPKGGPALTVPPNSGSGIGFFVSSTRPVVTTVELQCIPSGSVTSCELDQSEVILDPFGATDISASFTTGGVGNGMITVVPVGWEWDAGWRDVIVSGVAAPIVTQPRQPDSLVDRSHCLTAAVAWAAWSCGDGLFQLSTPAVTTLDRARALTLVHATNTASPRPWVMAEVTPPVGSSQPDHVTVELTVRDTLRRTAVYAGWGSGPRQVVLDWDAAAQPTGAYPYTLRVRAVGSTDSAATTVAGMSLVVNRSTTPVGRGWAWLGVEQLVLNQPVGSGQSHLLWVGGDGSAEFYRQASSTVWVGPRAAFPDTITLAGGEYTRRAPHGVQVVFNSAGRHVRTANRGPPCGGAGSGSTACGCHRPGAAAGRCGSATTARDVSTAWWWRRGRGST